MRGFSVTRAAATALAGAVILSGTAGAAPTLDLVSALVVPLQQLHHSFQRKVLIVCLRINLFFDLLRELSHQVQIHVVPCVASLG